MEFAATSCDLCHCTAISESRRHHARMEFAATGCDLSESRSRIHANGIRGYGRCKHLLTREWNSRLRFLREWNSRLRDGVNSRLRDGVNLLAEFAHGGEKAVGAAEGAGNLLRRAVLFEGEYFQQPLCLLTVGRLFQDFGAFVGIFLQ